MNNVTSNWSEIRNEWINRLSNYKSNYEYRVLKFLQKDETKDINYFRESIIEMESMCSKPNTNYKYFWFEDIFLLNKIFSQWNKQS